MIRLELSVIELILFDAVAGMLASALASLTRPSAENQQYAREFVTEALKCSARPSRI